MESRKWVLVGILLAGVFMFGETVATLANAADYYACQNTADGTLRMVTQGTVCKKSEIKISWPDPARVAALEAEVASLREHLLQYYDYFSALWLSEARLRVAADSAETAARQAADTSLTTNLNAEITARQTEDSNLQSSINSSTVPGLANYVTVTSGNGYPRILFTGVNVQLVNGSGGTYIATSTDPLIWNGLGNLIIGYDEIRPPDEPKECSLSLYENETDCTNYGYLWEVNHKIGSHNLIIGGEHNYAGAGGFVAGYHNTIYDINSVTGGAHNKASSYFASVSGGNNNHAQGWYSSVSGGAANHAQGWYSSVSGGDGNYASGIYSSVSGGANNYAQETFSSVSGGEGNYAIGSASSVSGGQSNYALGFVSSVSGGHENRAENDHSTVSGGFNNAASGACSTVSGGANNNASGICSTVSGGVGYNASGEGLHLPY